MEKTYEQLYMPKFKTQPKFRLKLERGDSSIAINSETNTIYVLIKGKTLYELDNNTKKITATKISDLTFNSIQHLIGKIDPLNFLINADRQTKWPSKDPEKYYELVFGEGVYVRAGDYSWLENQTYLLLRDDKKNIIKYTELGYAAELPRILFNRNLGLFFHIIGTHIRVRNLDLEVVGTMWLGDSVETIGLNLKTNELLVVTNEGWRAHRYLNIIPSMAYDRELS